MQLCDACDKNWPEATIYKWRYFSKIVIVITIRNEINFLHSDCCLITAVLHGKLLLAKMLNCISPVLHPLLRKKVLIYSIIYHHFRYYNSLKKIRERCSLSQKMLYAPRNGVSFHIAIAVTFELVDELK